MQTAIDVRHEQPAGKLISPADAPMVAMIERIAMDPNIPIDRLEKMMAMKERMEDRAREDAEREARKAYYFAMSRCQKALPVVTKTKRNDHTKSNYADLAAIEDQAMPIIHDFGFGVNFQPAGYNDKGELQIKWTISHEEGHSESDIAGIPVDGAGSQGKVNKTGTQAFGSTATYGRRYLLCMLFNISTGDDRDGNTPPAREPETISHDQVKIILQLLDETDSDIEQFCRMGKIEAVPDMLAVDFDDAVRLLNQKKAKLSQRAAS
ncbi:ERF family protein (plasmid) [Rhizobium leguminosarum bv. viciae]|uniref:ERF family protein n=1 Tax=Rhizobium leguminosarum TaxID=384 RepID=UPI000B8CCD43|nr:ERF family protein [Rhizobium leguminosarum]ASR12106.1 ERF family protein [Rhizobium leguminosarum bv. viciae]